MCVPPQFKLFHNTLLRAADMLLIDRDGLFRVADQQIVDDGDVLHLRLDGADRIFQ